MNFQIQHGVLWDTLIIFLTLDMHLYFIVFWVVLIAFRAYTVNIYQQCGHTIYILLIFCTSTIFLTRSKPKKQFIHHFHCSSTLHKPIPLSLF